MVNEKIELPVGYYLENFRRLVVHAQQYYPDLLSADETHWLIQFNRLTLPAQRLTVRLLTRKGCLFRSDKLNYQEIPDLNAALEELQASAFIQLSPKLSPFDLASQLLTKAEMISIYALTNKQLTKPKLLEQLSTDTQHYDCPFVVIGLENSAILDTLQLLFFANTHQDQSQFILEDLGLHTFENYSLNRQNRFFQKRHQLESLRLYGAISEHYYTHYKTFDPQQKLDALRQWHQQIIDDSIQIDDPITHRYADSKKQNLINTLARDFERLGQLDDALAMFETTQLPPSRERRVRMLLQHNNTEHAEVVINEMLDFPLSIEESEVATRLQVKLMRSCGNKVPREPKPYVDQDHLSLDLTHQRVELAAAEHYRSQGYSVYFVENAFLCGLFGLLYWDAIFAPVEGAFINAYQVQPKNLYSSKFKSLREQSIASCLDQFSQQGYTMLFDKLEQKNGVLNPFVFWQQFDHDLLTHAKQSLDPNTLLKLSQIILSDRKAFRSGMPDLVAFKDNKTYWIEVKGPGDKLQHNQWRWIKHFQALKLPIRVCYVNH